jgi:hypothetical protein
VPAVNTAGIERGAQARLIDSHHGIFDGKAPDRRHQHAVGFGPATQYRIGAQ